MQSIQFLTPLPTQTQQALDDFEVAPGDADFLGGLFVLEDDLFA
jgi:hypothetical protein